MPVFLPPLCPDCGRAPGQQHQDWCPDDGPVEGPKRIQMTRNKPWRKDNPDAVIVSRPSKWGNPYMGEGRDPDRAMLARLYSEMLDRPEKAELVEAIRRELRGKDLACWCPLDQPCHADVLLRVANSDQVAS